MSGACRFRAGACALLALSLIATAGGDEVTARAGGPDSSVEQPRAFGHVIGDVLTQRVRLAENADGSALATAPVLERIGAWFERLSAEELTGAGGARWLELRYQLVNSPPETRLVELPPLRLALAGGGERVVEPLPVAIGPLMPAGAADGEVLPALLPDRLPPAADTSALIRGARLAALALVVVLLSWLGWWAWRRRRDAVRLPFERAWREVRAAGTSDDPQAWSALHAALNATAGRTVDAGALDALLARQPWLAASRVRLEAFFAASSARFFERPPRELPFDIVALARELRRAERAQAR